MFSSFAGHVVVAFTESDCVVVAAVVVATIGAE